MLIAHQKCVTFRHRGCSRYQKFIQYFKSAVFAVVVVVVDVDVADVVVVVDVDVGDVGDVVVASAVVVVVNVVVVIRDSFLLKLALKILFKSTIKLLAFKCRPGVGNYFRPRATLLLY